MFCLNFEFYSSHGFTVHECEITYKMKVLFYIFIYQGKNQAFKISYLFYITEMILNKKTIIVQYKNTYSLKVTNYGYFECFI